MGKPIAKVLRRLSALEAKLDQKLFAAPSADEDESKTGHRNTRRVAEGAVIIGTGVGAHKLIQAHYGTQTNKSDRMAAYKNAGRDAVNSAKAKGKDLVKRARRTDVGYHVEGAARASENAVRTGVMKAKSAVAGTAKKVAKKIGLSHPLAQRIVELDARIDAAFGKK